MWEEIFEQIIKSNKHELSLSGDKLIQLIENSDGQLNADLFKLKTLNFLQLANSHILKDPVTNSWDELENLQQLLLHNNQLTELKGIDNLVHLKVLDLSHNKITSIDADFTKCTHLSSVNLSANQIASCSIKSTSIHTLSLSVNNLEEFPSVPPSITDLNISKNKLKVIPESINQQLPSLKILDLSENEITLVPKNLASIKLKTFNLKQNPLKDKKLHKLIEQSQALKAIIDHIHKLGISTTSATSNGNAQEKTQSEPKGNRIEIQKFDENFKIEFDPSVKEVRGFILCCIVKNLDLNATTLKEFLQFQTKLHETMCKKREIATIATHDLGLIPASKHLRYAAKHKDEIQIQPLKASKAVSGSTYFDTLKKEAEAYRKEKKRSNVTGVYKFLDLLKGKNEFAYLEAVDTRTCLSLPPLTNSDVTKLSTNTKEMLIEVTSHFNAAICNAVMLEMIKKVHQMSAGVLELQQVRTIFPDGQLKTLYPSKIDLKELESDEIQIVRP